jgi:pimeloyl-ACP methyl ester carboxylesterase
MRIIMQGPDLTFRSGRTRLRYRDEGEGPAIVLLHGWTLDLEVWDPQAADLSRSFRVIRPDRRGFGLSDGEPDTQADVADLEALLDHLGLAQSALVGMSQGARAAVAFALGHPGRVTALVLDGPPGDLAGLDGDEDDLSHADYRRLAQAEGLAAFRAEWRRHPLMRLHAGDAQAEALLGRILARYPGRDLLGPAPATPQPVALAALSRLPTPVLVVNGEHDTGRRRLAGEHLAGLLPRAERSLVPGAGHLANLDNPRAYDDMIRSFLRRRSRAAA